MKISTNLPLISTLFLTTPITLVAANNFNAVWGASNIPSQASVTPIAEALSTAKAFMDSVYESACASAGDSAVSKYHITGVGAFVTSTVASGPAAMITPAPVAYAAALGGILGAAVMVV